MQTARDKYPFYSWAMKHIPGYKKKAGNLAFRKWCIEKAVKDESWAHELYIMCSRDLLFTVNTFFYTYDPRRIPRSTVIAFNTYDFQDVTLDAVKNAIELGNDELIEKSRDMGATWMCLAVYAWMFLFRDYVSFRLISRTEDLVDKTDDPDSLLWKFDFIIEHLPWFLKPAYSSTHLHRKNEDNNSTVDGCSTTGDAARGGRCTSMFIDEMAAIAEADELAAGTQAVTQCRIFNSTHKGAGTIFYQLSRGKTPKIVLHWSLHPVKQIGLYHSKDGKLILLDRNFTGEVMVSGQKYQFPENYPFRLDGKLRSPWYDNECDRAAHPRDIAREQDMDPHASDSQFFDPELIDTIEHRDVSTPFLEGDIKFDPETLEVTEFIEKKGGPLRLWFNLLADDRTPDNIDFAGAFDISAGTGASNSTGSFGNLRTGEKLAEYVNPYIKPETFAKYAVILAKWFNDAFMIWDGGGVGRIFSDTVIEFGYRNIFYRQTEKGLYKKQSDIPGVFLNPEEKKAVLGGYQRDLRNGDFLQRSHEANQECLSYIFTESDTIEHSASVHSSDPSGAKANHGDRVIADALLAKACKARKTQTEINEKESKYCFAYRRQERLKKLNKSQSW